MEEVMLDERESTYRKRRKKNKNALGKRKLKIFLVVLSICIWGGVVYYGYTAAKSYIDTSINNVQQQNAMNLSEINEQVVQLKNEISELRISIEDTDSSISSTGTLQENIDKQLSALDTRLKELEKSLKILQEAP